MEHRIKFPIRLPPELRDQIIAEAKRSDRSANGEIVHRLRESLKQTKREAGAA